MCVCFYFPFYSTILYISCLISSTGWYSSGSVYLCCCWALLIRWCILILNKWGLFLTWILLGGQMKGAYGVATPPSSSSSSYRHVCGGAPKTVVHLCLTSTWLFSVAPIFTSVFVYVQSLIWFLSSSLSAVGKAWVCRVRTGCLWGVWALWSRPFKKDLPVILHVCPALPPSSAHCAAVAWDGLPNASGMGGLRPKSRKTLRFLS